MPRAAGKANHYSFVLKRYDGSYDQGCTIELPSVTSIIGATLAKPWLTDWAYRLTRDNVSGMIQVLDESPDADWGSWVEVLSDPDMLEEYLKQNKLRPNDVRDLAGERGTDAHAFLEKLSTLALTEDHGAADDYVASHEPKDAYQAAVAKWWNETNPKIIQSESILPCPSLGYAGTVDLVYSPDLFQKVLGATSQMLGSVVTVTDLKTRKAGAGVYDSDKLQAIAYRVAYELMTGTKADCTTILLAYDDGTYLEEEVDLPDEAWYDCLAFYKSLRRKR